MNHTGIVDRQRVLGLSLAFHLWSPMPFGNINKFPQYPSSVGVIFLITDDKLGSKQSEELPKGTPYVTVRIGITTQGI